MEYLINYMMHRASKFTVLDFAVLKTYLLSIGLLLGATFTKLFKKLRPMLALVSLFSCVYMLYIIFVRED